MLFLAAAIDWNHLPVALLRKAGNEATTARSITLMRSDFVIQVYNRLQSSGHSPEGKCPTITGEHYPTISAGGHHLLLFQFAGRLCNNIGESCASNQRQRVVWLAA
jgi:hypothetical protein